MIITGKKRYINEVVELLGISSLKWKKNWGKKPQFSMNRISDQEVHYHFDYNSEEMLRELNSVFGKNIKIKI